MPYVNVQITKGATCVEKQTIVNTLKNNPEHIHIVIQEIEE